MARDANEVDANLKGIDAAGVEHTCLTDDQGRLLSGGGVAPTGVATSANQTNGDQKTGLVNAAKVSINPAKEDGNLLTMATAMPAASAKVPSETNHTSGDHLTRIADTSKAAIDPAKEAGNLLSVKTAVELVASAIATIGAAIGAAKALVLGGYDGTLIRAIRSDASGFLIPKSPTATDFKVQEDSAAAILAKLDVALSTRALEAGGNLAAVATAAGKLADDRKLIPLPFTCTAKADGEEVELTGFGALAYYTLLQFNSTPHTGGGIATHRQRRIYRATGGAIADLCWEEAAAVAVADGTFVPYSELGNVCKADAAGKMWLRYEVTGGGTITETGDLHFFPLRTA